jgi:MFS family permease
MASQSPANTPQEHELRALSERAYAHVLNAHGTASGRRTGWVMISTILIEAWDLYSISFLLIFIKDEFHPSALMLGLASASVQLGALFGTLCGGWLADRFGRRPMFLTTMVLFIVLALAQGFVTDMWQLVVLRFLLGFPLGSDIATGYTYIMETMPRRQREIMGSRWQGMFGLGEIAAIVAITIMYLAGMGHGLLWRVALALGALPALILLLHRLRVPDTVGSLIQRGRFRQAKQVARTMFGDELAMLPDEDYQLRRPSTRDFLADIWSDPVRRKASIFAWISNVCQGAEFATFGFYLPIILVLAGVSGLAATNFLTGGIYIVATVAGFVGPLMLARIGHRGVASWGFGIVFVSMLVAALFLQLRWLWLVPLAAAVLMWGHYWAASNGMTIASMVAPSRYKGTASGFGYVFVKLPLFITLFIFPAMFEGLGIPLATTIAAVIPLAGFLAARFVLPEVYGHVEAAATAPDRG